jgi:fluoride exporter
MLMPTICIGFAGLAGVVLRFWLTIWFPSLWTIVVINLVGSFVLGALTHVGGHMTHDIRNALGVGFVGGFTTFSTLTVQTVLEADGGKPQRAAAYFLISVIGGLVCAVVGYTVVRKHGP